MSLDIYLTAVKPTIVFDSNITHNLSRMASEAGIYECVWRPEEAGIETASDLIEHLKPGIALMESDPDRFRTFNAENGWGTYNDFVPWLKRLLEACEANPDATVGVFR